jgi:hypothetical protein
MRLLESGARSAATPHAASGRIPDADVRILRPSQAVRKKRIFVIAITS